MTTVAFFAHGKPVPQGSKRIGRNRATGKAILLDDNDKPLKAWRTNVTRAAAAAMQARGLTTIDEPCKVAISFYFPRPAGHLGTGRNAGTVKASAPEHPSVKPDLDKCIRAILDALTSAAVFYDDSRVVEIEAGKFYAAEAGAAVVVTTRLAGYGDPIQVTA